jgi:hypothetical protein
MTPYNKSSADYNMAVSCKYNKSEVTAHSCEFSCAYPYVCAGTKCDLPYCATYHGSRFNDAEGVYTGGVARRANQNWKYLKADTLTEFQNAVAGKEGCYFWCTGSNYYPYTYYEHKAEYEAHPEYYDDWIRDNVKC